MGFRKIFKKLLTKKRNEKGFSIIEILIGAAMLGIASMSTVILIGEVYDITAGMELENIADNLVNSRLMFIKNNTGSFSAGCNPFESDGSGNPVNLRLNVTFDDIGNDGEWIEDGLIVIKGTEFCSMTAIVTNPNLPMDWDTRCALPCSHIDADGLTAAALTSLTSDLNNFVVAQSSYAIVKVVFAGAMADEVARNLMSLFLPQAYAFSPLQYPEKYVKISKIKGVRTRVRIMRF